MMTENFYSVPHTNKRSYQSRYSRIDMNSCRRHVSPMFSKSQRRRESQVSVKLAAILTLALSTAISSAFQTKSLIKQRMGTIRWSGTACLGIPPNRSASFHPVNHLRRRSNVPLGVVTDPQQLSWTESVPYIVNTKSTAIEKLYQLSADEQFYPHSEEDVTKQPGSPSHVRHRRQISETRAAHTSSTVKSPVPAFQRLSPSPPTHAVTKAKKGISRTRSSRSSTMPGFAAITNRQRAYRDGIRLAERQAGRKYNETADSKMQRKKANGEAMYLSSPAVPESMMQFANEIHREDRISRKEEIALGQKTQEALRLQNHYDILRVKLQREPTDEEWCAASGKINMEAIRQAIEEGVEAKNKLVTSNLRMVQSVVNTYIRNGLSAQYNAGDLMQEGIMALIRAAEKFEPERGWKFSTYAMYWIRSSVKRSQISQSRTVTVPQRLHENYKRILKLEADLTLKLERKPTKKEIGECMGMSEIQVARCIAAMKQRCYSLDQELTNTKKPLQVNGQSETLVDILDTNLDDHDHENLEQRFLREDLVETLNRHLNPWEVDILMLRYGLKEIPGLKFNSQPTIAEISKFMGVTPDKVRKTIKRSLDRLRTAGHDEWISFQRHI